MLNAIAHGRVGRDTELRYNSDGTAVADVAIACNYGRKNSEGKQPTQWVKATLWGKQAEGLAQYLTKGKGVVALLSDLHVRTFDKSDGTQGVSLDGRVDSIEFTGAGPREEGSAPAPAPRPAAKPAAKTAPRPSTGFDDMDDDIPF
jgi:single-strand DNA-binding protein